MKKLFRSLLLTLGALVAFCVVGAVAFYFQYDKDLYVPFDGPPPAAVLLAATQNAARGVGASGEFGTIEIGKYADLLLVRGEPWRNIGHLRDIDTVIQNGRIVAKNSENAD